jgi:hypothetical protein
MNEGTAMKDLTVDEAELVNRYAALLDDVGRAAIAVQEGNWQYLLETCRRTARHADALAAALTAPTEIGGQLVLAYRDQSAKAPRVLAALREVAGMYRLVRALHSEGSRR